MQGLGLQVRARPQTPDTVGTLRGGWGGWGLYFLKQALLGPYCGHQGPLPPPSPYPPKGPYEILISTSKGV